MSATEVVASTVEETPKVEPVTAEPEVGTTSPDAPKEETVVPPADSTSPPVPENTEAVENLATMDQPATELAQAEGKQEDKAITTDEKPAEKPARPKSPGLLAKLLSPFKGEKKAKSPKKDKKKEETHKEDAAPVVTEEATPVVEDAPKEEVAESTPAPAEEPTTATEIAVPVEPAKDGEVTATEAPATETVAPIEVPKEEVKPAEDKVKEAAKKSNKVGRRLSSRITDLLKPAKKENKESLPPKVTEEPPVLEAPAAMEPLENPAEGQVKPGEPIVSEEASKPTEISAAPVVAAAA